MLGFPDEQLFSLVDRLVGNWFVNWLFVFGAKYLIYLLLIFFLIAILKEKNFERRFYYFSLATIGAIISRGIATPLIRFWYYRPRPFVDFSFDPLISHPLNSSFPSGHMAFLIPLSLVLWFLNKKAGSVFILASLIVGFSRIAVGVHWPSDILGGILIGIAGFVLAQLILKKVKPK
ncbi:MAG: phosphatase PAP2 family protein [Candidatus Colwellbacteria bacterium]|nr:phosphatase PAP2 family protein [Candidatus Colwellbacteria bacterium]